MVNGYTLWITVEHDFHIVCFLVPPNSAKKKTKRVVQKYIKPSSYILRIYRWCYRTKMVVAICSLGGEGTVFY